MAVSGIDIHTITNLYLYGQRDRPTDLLSDNLIRDAGAVTTVDIDTQDYMSIVGRFAVGSQFGLIQRFFAGLMGPGSGTETIRMTKEQLAAYFDMDFYGLTIKQLEIADGLDDYAERTYIWNSSSFMIHPDTRFVIEPDGTKYIENFAIVPRPSTPPDNFDFVTGGLAQLGNSFFLEPRIDPSGIGRKVEFNFTGDVLKTTYTLSDFQADLAFEQTFTQKSLLNALNAVEAVSQELFDAGTTATLGAQGEPIIYGTNNGDEIATSDVDFGWLEAPTFLEALKSRGVSVVAGDGDDTVSLDYFVANGRFDLRGGDGVDSLDLSSLSNTQAELTISSVDGDVMGVSPTIEFRGFERLLGGSADDYFYLTGEEEYIDGAGGKDTADFSLAQKAIGPITLAGIDIIRGSQFSERFEGGSDPVEIYGGGGADQLIGGDGADKLFGSDDNEADTLTGGGGADVFYVGDGDVVTDATAGDRLALSTGKYISGEATRPEGESGSYTSDAGYTFTLEGTDLTINAGGKTFTVQHFADGDLGITLREEDDDDNDNPETPEPPRPNGGGNPIGNGGGMGSPLVFDLDGDGVELIRLVDSGAYFDIDRNGLAEWTGWVGSDDGFLTLDHNTNGQVDGADELFGYSYTIPTRGGPDDIGGASGFAELAEYDLNFNGKIDSSDAVYANLKIWRDLNGDGSSEIHELFGLADLGIESISLDAEPADLTDAGNWISDTGTFKWADGSTGAIADVWFRYDAETTRSPDAVDIPSQIAGLPNLSGGGRALDLHSVAAGDAHLAQLLETFTAFDVADAARILPTVEAIVFAWLGAGDASETGRGQYVDGRIVTALETYYGQDYQQQGASDPRMQAGAYLTEDFQKMVSMLALKLLAQTDLGAVLLPGLDLRAGTVLTIDPAATLEGWIANLELKAPEDVSDKHAFWLSAAKLIAYLQPTLGFTTPDFVMAMDEVFEDEGLGFAYSSLIPAGSTSPVPMLFIGSDGGDRPVGRQSSITQFEDGSYDNGDVFFGGRGNDILRGLTGSDTYIFTRESGTDVIEEISKNGFFMPIEQDEDGDINAIVFADDVVASELIFGRAGYSDLKISVPNGEGGFSFIIVRNYFSDPATVLSEIRFADGTSMSYVDIQNRMPATAGADYLFVATEGAPVDALGGDDRIDGNELDQSYVFGAGSGRDQVLDRGGDDTILFKAGLTASDLILRKAGQDLVVRLAGQGDTLTILDYFASDGDGRIETFRFSNGSTLDAAGIVDILKAGTAGDDALIGGDGADILNGGAGADFQQGGRGDDVYVFGLGSDADRVQELQGADTIQFGAGVAASDLLFARSGWYSENLVIQIAGTEDRLTIEGYFGDENRRIETFVFADGTTLSHSALEALIPPPTGTSDDEKLYGANGDDVLDGAGGDDYLSGGAGDDLYVFGQGYGSDFISDYEGADTLSFAPGVAFDDLIWDTDVTTLIIRIAGSDDKVVINSPFLGDEGVETYTFADGLTLTQQDVLALVFGGTPGEDIVQGIVWLDYVVDLGAGDDYFQGYTDNVFAFGTGSGHDTIVNVDTVQIKAGVGIGDVSFSLEGGDAIVTIDATGETLRLDGGLGYGLPRITLDFQDGGTLTDVDIGTAILATAGTVEADAIRALSDGVNILNGGAGDDTLTADYGTSIVEFGVGFGTDTVLMFGAGDRIRFDASIVPENLTLSINDGDLIFSVGQDRLVLESFFYDGSGRPRETSFDGIDFTGSADWTWNDVTSHFRIAAVGGEWLLGGTVGDNLIGTSGAEILLSGDGADTLSGGSGDGDILDGGDGGDTYHFNLGDGRDQIFEERYDDGVDTVTFGPGVSKDEIQVNAADWREVTITVTGTTDTLKIDDLVAIENFVFEDGVLTASQIANLAIASQNTSGDDQVEGFDVDSTFAGGAGDDVLKAGAAGNTFVFEGAFGHDLIDGHSASDGWDELVLADLVPSDVAVRQSLDEDGEIQLVISSLSGERSITLAAWTGNDWGGNDTSQFVIRFADDTTWDRDAANIASMLNSSTPGNDFIVGDDDNETFDAGAGDDVIYGEGGSDVVIFGAGYGKDTFHGGQVQVAISGGLELSDLQFRREGGSYQDETYVVSIIGTDDEIRITDIGYAISDLSFMIGGLNYSYPSLSDLFHKGTAGADRLKGSGDHDLIEGLGGDDTLIGDWGEDDYVFGVHFGSDVIIEIGGSEGLDIPPMFEEDTVVFTAYEFTDLVFSRVGDDLGDLLIVGGGGDRILIEDFYVSLTSPDQEPLYGIDRFIFADNTVMLREAFDGVAADLSGNNTVETGNDGGVLEGGDGDDTLAGGRGDDTYVFGLGDKSDLIQDAGGGSDVIAFKPGIDALNVASFRVGDDLVLQVEGAGGLSITVAGQFAQTGPVVESFVFDDGTVWTWEEVRDAALAENDGGEGEIVGAAGDDFLIATAADDVIRGLGGDDWIDGAGGLDTIMFEGAGADYVWSRQADGSVTARSLTTLTTTQLYNVEFAKFGGDQEAFEIRDLVADYGTDGDDDWIEGTAGADNLFGLGGDDTLAGRDGDDIIDGGGGEDVLSVAGAVADYAISRNADGTVSLVGAEGADTLIDMEAIYFEGPSAWRSIESLVGQYGTQGGDSWIEGSASGDNLYGLDGDDTLIGRAGDDVINGGDGYDQANFVGDFADFVFTREADGRITVTDTTLAEGRDTLIGIEAVYFEGSGTWAALNNLVANYGTSGDDDFVEGTAFSDHVYGLAGDDNLVGREGDDFLYGGEGFDQANYYGSSNNFSFTLNPDGTVTVADLVGDEGSDVLDGIEAVYFDGDQMWGTIEDALGLGGAARSSSGGTLTTGAYGISERIDDDSVGHAPLWELTSGLLLPLWNADGSRDYLVA